MTNLEFTAARLALGANTSQLARCLGVTRATVHNLASGRVRIRPAMALLVDLLVALHRADPGNRAIPAELRAAANDNEAEKEVAA
jgi:transcriptional regulator with XRE-family HTH domain